MSRIVLVTGTSTDVGKTIVTAALAAATAATGARVGVVKPVQTGVGAHDAGDVDVVSQLAGVDTHEFVRLRDPLAPDTAARREGVTLPRVAEHAADITALAQGYDVVFVEGAGGVLVRLDDVGGTLLDLAAALDVDSVDLRWVVVCAAGLGTLNHTELTLRAIEACCAGSQPGLVIGAWPRQPGLAEQCNLEDLARLAPLLGSVPAGAGVLASDAFRAQASGWFTSIEDFSS